MIIKILKNLKKKAGYVRRGIFGLIINNLEKAPVIDSEIKKTIIGSSVMGAAVNCYEIGKGITKIIFISAIHGNEIGTVKLAHYLIDYLKKQNDLKDRFTFYIISCLNPDGYHEALRSPDYFNGGKVGRLNSNKVDLNRNFPTPGFKKKSIYSFGKNYQEKEKIYCGEYGGSEPEIKALTNFIKNNNIKVSYFFHNAGKDVMGNNNALSQNLVKLYCEKTGYRLVSDKEWQKMDQTGTAKEWCEIDNIAYVEVEGSSRWGSDWKNQKCAIEATLEYLKTSAK